MYTEILTTFLGESSTHHVFRTRHFFFTKNNKESTRMTQSTLDFLAGSHKIFIVQRSL